LIALHLLNKGMDHMSLQCWEEDGMKKEQTNMLQKKLRRLSFKNWHQKKESRRREWNIERGRSLYRYILSPLFVSSLNLFLIPADFRWQTMTDNIRQPQLTRDRKDQCKWSKRIFLQSPVSSWAWWKSSEHCHRLFPVWPESWSEAEKFTLTFRTLCECLPSYVIALFFS